MEKDIKPEELEKLKVKFEVEMEQAKSDANEGKKWKSIDLKSKVLPFYLHVWSISSLDLIIKFVLF